MLWIAFVSPPSPDVAEPDDLNALAMWALQFSPRVVRRGGAVLVELEASERLFGGRRALLQRLSAECGEFGAAGLAVAPTARAAQALGARLLADGAATGPAPARISCTGRTLQTVLDALPLSALPELDVHGPTLMRLGCSNLGHVRRLPRGGLARRFPGLLQALDGAYGLVAEAFEWEVLPAAFDVRLELHSRVDTAPGLMFGAQRLLQQLRAWLAARQAGAGAVCLGWEHDLHRRGEAGSGEVLVRSGEPTRDIAHLGRLLSEHLARLSLAAPAVAIRLRAVDVAPLEVQSGTLLPDPRQSGSRDFAQLLERLSARLGPDAVLTGQVVADHRPEIAQRWQPWGKVPAAARGGATEALPGRLVDEPPWLLESPLKLAVVRNRPVYQGPLEILAGPQRLESGWWGGPAAAAARDYYVAASSHAGLLWIYRERPVRETRHGEWFLHGIYG